MEILIISGLSGAGKSKAASFLEDMGFYIVDNMPAAMILRFAEFCTANNGRYDRVALVYDVRTATSPTELFSVLDALRTMDSDCRLLFLEADAATIIRRYKESRRRHPLSEHTSSLEEAVREEQQLMEPIRARADYRIDTTDLPLAELREKIITMFDTGAGIRDGLTVRVVAFGYKYGLPLEADLVLDVRFLPNPFYLDALRPLTGLDAPVEEYVMSFPQSRTYLQKVEDLLTYTLPLYVEEGKTSLVIAVGCTGGQHRSAVVAKAIAAMIRDQGYRVNEIYRDLHREG